MSNKKLWYTDNEILLSYKTAKHKHEQIKILSELNSCTEDDIKDILVSCGIDRKILDAKNEYRDIIWNTDIELALNLGKSKSYITMKLKEGKTRQEIIDEVLDYKQNEYRGITWTSDKELSIKLGKSKGYVWMLVNHQGYTHEELIDKFLDNAGNKPKSIVNINSNTESINITNEDNSIKTSENTLIPNINNINSDVNTNNKQDVWFRVEK